jgi:WhiB family redox-sensing transcriptional regulator
MSSNLRNKYAPSSERGTNWRDRAECLTEDPELFFPVGVRNNGSGYEQQERAKKVCGRCAVREACLSFALETNQNDGVWGGLGENERRALRRRAFRERRLGSAAIERD